ncbi:MAG: hypothetical protein WDW38_003643 [Sanguina aurantia]
MSVRPPGQMDYASAALRASRDGPAAAGADLNPLAKQPLLVPIQEIAAAFWRDTAAGRAMRAELARPFDKSKSHPAALVKTKYALSPWEAIWVVSQRQLLMVAKDPVLVKGRLAQVSHPASDRPLFPHSFLSVGRSLCGSAQAVMNTRHAAGVRLFAEPGWCR